MLLLNTGAPQGCVLSPFLFTLYNQRYTPRQQESSIVRYMSTSVDLGHHTSPPWLKNHRKGSSSYGNLGRLNSGAKFYQLLQGSSRKDSDWKRHKLAWFITAQDRKAIQCVIKTTGTSLVPSTEHQ